MKTKLIITITLILFIAFSSCEKSVDFNPDLAVDHNILTLPVSGGSTKIIVYSSTTWTAKFIDNPDWITITNPSGKGTQYLVVQSQPKNNQNRSAILVITIPSSKSVNIQLNQ